MLRMVAPVDPSGFGMRSLRRSGLARCPSCADGVLERGRHQPRDERRDQIATNRGRQSVATLLAGSVPVVVALDRRSRVAHDFAEPARILVAERFAVYS